MNPSVVVAQVLTQAARLRAALMVAGAAWVAGLTPSTATRVVLAVLLVLVLVLDGVAEVRRASKRRRRVVVIPAQRSGPPTSAGRTGGAK